MKHIFQKTAILTLLLCLFSAHEGMAQKSPNCVKAASTKRPTHVLASLSKLNAFCKNFAGDGTKFNKMKIVRSELAYYLMASAENGTGIYVFELEQKGKKLYLNRELPMQSCSEGEFSLDTFLQENGKITGCRMGSHSIRQHQK